MAFTLAETPPERKTRAACGVQGGSGVVGPLDNGFGLVGESGQIAASGTDRQGRTSERVQIIEGQRGAPAG